MSNTPEDSPRGGLEPSPSSGRAAQVSLWDAANESAMANGDEAAGHMASDGWPPPGSPASTSPPVPRAIVPPPPVPLRPQTFALPPASRPQTRLPVVVGLLAAIVLVAGLTAVLTHDDSPTPRFVTVASSLNGPNVFSPPTSVLPPAQPPAVPDGYTLHTSPVGYQVALPNDWIVIDVTGNINGAFTDAEQAHPDRAETITNVHGTLTNETLIALGPPLGPIVTDMRIRVVPTAQSVTDPGFIAAFTASIQDDSSGSQISDLTATPTTVAGRPALHVAFHHTKTLTSGATDEVYTFIMIVDGPIADASITMNTDNPMSAQPLFDTAASTLVANT
jgi:hypothetical protein